MNVRSVIFSEWEGEMLELAAGLAAVGTITLCGLAVLPWTCGEVAASRGAFRAVGRALGSLGARLLFPRRALRGSRYADGLRTAY